MVVSAFLFTPFLTVTCTELLLTSSFVSKIKWFLFSNFKCWQIIFMMQSRMDTRFGKVNDICLVWKRRKLRREIVKTWCVMWA